MNILHEECSSHCIAPHNTISRIPLGHDYPPSKQIDYFGYFNGNFAVVLGKIGLKRCKNEKNK